MLGCVRFDDFSSSIVYIYIYIYFVPSVTSYYTTLSERKRFRVAGSRGGVDLFILK